MCLFCFFDLFQVDLLEWQFGRVLARRNLLAILYPRRSDLLLPARWLHYAQKPSMFHVLLVAITSQYECTADTCMCELVTYVE